jgi:hypothetical protein
VPCPTWSTRSRNWPETECRPQRTLALEKVTLLSFSPRGEGSAKSCVCVERFSGKVTKLARLSPSASSHNILFHDETSGASFKRCKRRLNKSLVFNRGWKRCTDCAVDSVFQDPERKRGLLRSLARHHGSLRCFYSDRRLGVVARVLSLTAKNTSRRSASEPGLRPHPSQSRKTVKPSSRIGDRGLVQSFADCVQRQTS